MRVIRVAITAIIVSTYGCAALNCSRLKPDGGIPACTECTSCSVPGDATTVTLNLDDKILPNGAERYRDLLNGDDSCSMTVTPHRNRGITIHLECPGSAPDVYRVVEVARNSHTESHAFWLTGNNKGKGVVCEMTLAWRKEDLDGGQYVKSWSQVLADKCF